MYFLGFILYCLFWDSYIFILNFCLPKLEMLIKNSNFIISKLTYAFVNFLVSTAVLGTLKGASAVYAPTTFVFPCAVTKR